VRCCVGSKYGRINREGGKRKRLPRKERLQENGRDEGDGMKKGGSNRSGIKSKVPETKVP
jgi:hypothetical protein